MYTPSWVEGVQRDHSLEVFALRQRRQARPVQSHHRIHCAVTGNDDKTKSASFTKRRTRHPKNQRSSPRYSCRVRHAPRILVEVCGGEKGLLRVRIIRCRFRVFSRGPYVADFGIAVQLFPYEETSSAQNDRAEDNESVIPGPERHEDRNQPSDDPKKFEEASAHPF